MASKEIQALVGAWKANKKKEHHGFELLTTPGFCRHIRELRKDGYKYDEISAKLGICHRTISNALRKSRNQ
jgi:DNA-binding NarL/FixJ family response regulator